MPAQNIIADLEYLLSLHRELFEKAKLKTEILKVNNVSALKEIVNDERNYFKIINLKQKELLEHARGFLQHQSIANEIPTLRDCIYAANEQDRQTLTALQTELIETVSLLKQQNDLNQLLLEQSLELVQISIDLLTPDLDTYNYERPDRHQQYEQLGRSLFDSNA